MAIRKDLSDLPRAEPDAGQPPSTNPKLTTMLGLEWYRQHVEAGRMEYGKAIPDLPYRASWAALRCDRALWAAMHDVPESDPPSVADAWRMELGSLVGESLQSVLRSLEGWESELVVDLQPAGIPGSAHVDLAKPRSDGTGYSHLVEVKTINGFSFKRCATGFKGAPAGPRFGHLMQVAAAGVALGADRVGVVYLSMENVSKDLAERYCGNGDIGRFAAEWWWDVNSLTSLVEKEAARIRRLVASDQVPWPALDDVEAPPGAVVVDPAKGNWQVRQGDVVITTGRHWMCGYCRHQQWCINQPATPTSKEAGI